MLRKIITEIIFCLCFIFAVAAPVVDVCASMVRVETMGAGSLVPDEETDLNYNPAFVTYIEGQRIFSGIDLLYNSSETTERPSESSKNTTESKRRSITPNFEYVYGMSDVFKFAIKYNPVFSKNTAESVNDWDQSVPNNSDIEEYKSKLNNFADTRMLIGVSLIPGVKIGYSVSYSNYKRVYEYKSYWEDSIYVYKSRDEESCMIYYQNLGFIFGGENGNRYAFNVGQTGWKSVKKDWWDNYESGFLRKKKTGTIGLQAGFIPEMILSDSLILRTNISCIYLHEKPKYSYAPAYTGLQIYNFKNIQISDGIGAGLNYKHSAGTLFSFTLLTDGYISKDSYNEAYNKSTANYSKFTFKTISRNISAGLGLEKEILPQLLTIRCKVVPFEFQYEKYVQKEQNQNGVKLESDEHKTTKLLGPVYSYSLGIGYQPYENIIFDMNFSQISSMHSKEIYTEKFYPGKDTEKIVTDNYSLNFNVTCKF